MIDGAPAPDKGSREVVENVRTVALEVFERQLTLLGDARRSHSHSDLLTPPDLATNVLTPNTLELKNVVESVVGAYEGDQRALRDLVQRDLFSFESRKFVQSVLVVGQGSSDEGPTTESVENVKSLFDRFDIVLNLEENEVIDFGLPLLIHEEVMERLTIEECARHFDYFESRIAQLTRGLVPGKGKGIVLLRICNELIRRLSKPTRQHTIFAGRVLTLLSSVLPFGERSGVNARSDFNADNKTTVDKLEAPDVEDEEESAKELDKLAKAGEEEQEETQSVKLSREERRAANVKAQREADEKLSQAAHDPLFYSMFWNLQAWFANPTLLFEDTLGEEQNVRMPAEASDPVTDGTTKEPFRAFRRSTRHTLNVVAAVGRIEKELAGGKANDGGRRPVERRESINGPPRRSADLDEAGVDLTVRPTKRQKRPTNDALDEQEATEEFFPKYLTGRTLFEYELRDVSFRRHVLVQFLILFQYLLSFTQKYREQLDEWKNKTLVNALKSITFVLDEADERWIRDTWREVISLLNAIPPEGRPYADTVTLILRRETNWLRWKSADCPPIDCQPLSEEQLDRFTRARKPLLQPLRPYPHVLGTAALSRLWEDGVRKPEPRVRTMENAEGMEVQVQTDGLDDLEMGPMVPTWESYAAQIEALETRAQRRRAELEWAAPQPYIVGGATTTAEMRKVESERIVREEMDAALAQCEQRRSVLAWRAMRMARWSHLSCFAKMRCEMPDGATTIGVRIDDVTRLVRAISDKENGIPAIPTPAPAPPTSIVEEESPLAEEEEDKKLVDNNDAEDKDVKMGEEEEKDVDVSTEPIDAVEEENRDDVGKEEKSESPEYEPQESGAEAANEDGSPPGEKVGDEEMAGEDEQDKGERVAS